MKITFYYEGGGKYKAGNVIDFNLEEGCVKYSTLQEQEDGINIASSVRVPKNELLGISVDVASNETQVFKFKKKAAIIAGVIN